MRGSGLARTWPLPALLSWALGWAVFALLRGLAAPLPVAAAAGTALGAVLAVLGSTPWRRVFMAGGFPCALAASGLAGAMPAWGWLLPLGLLAVLYPFNTWRDAPLFPTPPQALHGLAQRVPLADGARILDAGCGLGDGLRELRREYPGAVLLGLEWSWPLRLLCAWRRPDATVRRADIWRADWSGHDLVYAFQRPERMDRAVRKAARELAPGGWLASLEFEAPGFVATAVLDGADGRRLYLYRMPLQPRPAAA